MMKGDVQMLTPRGALLRLSDRSQVRSSTLNRPF